MISQWGRWSNFLVRDNRKCTKWPQNELEYLTVKSTLFTLNTYFRDPNFCPFHFTTSCFEDTMLLKIGKNRKCIEWPQTYPEHFTVKNTLYILSTYLQRPNFLPFRSTASRFPDTRLSKSGKIINAPNDIKLTEHLTVKVPCIHKVITHEAQIMVRFALRPAVFKTSHIL